MCYEFAVGAADCPRVPRRARPRPIAPPRPSTASVVDIGDAPAHSVRVARNAVGVPLCAGEEVHAGKRVVKAVVERVLAAGLDRLGWCAPLAVWRGASVDCGGTNGESERGRACAARRRGATGGGRRGGSMWRVCTGGTCVQCAVPHTRICGRMCAHRSSSGRCLAGSVHRRRRRSASCRVGRSIRCTGHARRACAQVFAPRVAAAADAARGRARGWRRHSCPTPIC